MKGKRVVVYSDELAHWSGSFGTIMETGMMVLNGRQVAGARVRMEIVDLLVDWPLTDLRQA